MQIFATFRLPDDRLVDAVPGDLVGRLPSAAVRLNDPRISEAHALVSLRGRGLRLLALRGRFAVGGVVTSDVELKPGLSIQLAPGIELVVTAVTLQDSVFGLEGPDVARQVLPPVASLRAEAGEVVPGFLPDADALLWTSGRSLHLRLPGRPDTPLVFGARFAVGAREYRIVPIALSSADTPPTDRGADLDAPLVVVLRYDTVHIQRGAQVSVIDGLPARLMTELGLMGVPVEWRTLALLLWPGNEDTSALRGRWDRVLSRLRQQLRGFGLRPDLVRTDGAGRIELLLGPRDRIRDDT